MKVVHVIGSLTRSGGGVFTALSGLARAQLESGMDVTVIGGIDAHFDEDRAAWSGVSLIPIATRFRYAMVPGALRAIRRVKPDLVHVHGIWSDSSVIGRALAATGTPICVSPHGMLDPWILRRRPRLKAFHAALFERPLMARAAIHALTDAERRDVLDFMGTPDVTALVAPNGVIAPPPPFDQPRSGAIYVGRLHEKKQVIELINTWGKTERLRDTVLKIAGWGDDAYQSKVSAACASYPNTSFVGAVYGDDKDRMFRRARFMILPSVSEGLPMAVIEAISYGVIPIITPECHLDHLIEMQAAIGMASDFRDFPAVAEVMASNDQPSFERFSERALKASEEYRWPSIVGRYRAGYDLAMARRRVAMPSKTQDHIKP